MDVRTENGGKEKTALTIRLGEAEIEAIAGRVVELLGGEGPVTGLIDAAEVAVRLGISRATVYEKAEELGAVRLGSGSRARLRFDPVLIAERLAASRPAGAGLLPDSRRSPARRPPRRRSTDTRDLLPIRGEVAP